MRLRLRPRRKLRQVIGLLGQPRSGTTLLASMLGAHPRINAIFEPWNMARNLNRTQLATQAAGLDDFLQSFEVKMSPEQDVLLVKETTAYPTYADNLGSLLASLPAAVAPGLIIIVRNPIHVYLSEIEARRKWWGADELAVSAQTFDSWARRTLDSIVALKRLAERFDGVVIAYEKLTKSPESVGKLLRFFGLRLRQEQIDYQHHIGHLRVAGDLGVEKDPQPVSDVSVARRAVEFEQVRGKIAGARHYGAIVDLAEWMDRLSDKDPMRGVLKSAPVASEGAVASVPLFAPPGHVYSPIVAPSDIEALFPPAQPVVPPALSDVKLDLIAMEKLWNGLAPAFAALGPAVKRRPLKSSGIEGDETGLADWTMLRAMISHVRPSRLVAVGLGYPSTAIFDVLDAVPSDNGPRATIIERYPERLSDLLTPDDLARVELIAKPLPDVDPGVFDGLGPSDFLLVDSSHVLKTGSDVAQLLGLVLPRLAAGTIICFRQVFYPFEYPRKWAVEDNRSWNEAYALRAFLAYNSSFEVIFFNDYFGQMRRALIEDTGGAFSGSAGSGLWLKRVS